MMGQVFTNYDSGRIESLYVRFSEAPIFRTVEDPRQGGPEALIDLDERGQLVGIEFLTPEIWARVCGFFAQNLPNPYQRQVQELCQA